MRAFIGVELLRKLPPGPVDIRDTTMRGFVLRVRAEWYTYLLRDLDASRAKWPAASWRLAVRSLRRAYPLAGTFVGTTAVLSAPEAREQARQVLADVAKRQWIRLRRSALNARRITFDVVCGQAL